MSIGKITIEGTAQIEAPSITCVCGFCGEPAGANSVITFDFRQQKVLYLCGNKKCKKMNEISLRVEAVPYPKMRIGR